MCQLTPKAGTLVFLVALLSGCQTFTGDHHVIQSTHVKKTVAETIHEIRKTPAPQECDCSGKRRLSTVVRGLLPPVNRLPHRWGNNFPPL